MKFNLHILKNPSGTYSFVGNVPIELAVNNFTNMPLDELIEAVHLDNMLPSKYRKFESRSFKCYSDALNAANELGYKICEPRED